MKTANTVLWTLVGLSLLAVCAVAAYKIRPLLNPEIAATAPLDPECDLRAGPCSALFTGGGKVSFGISPEAIPVVEPLRLEVRLEGLEARDVEVDFQGVDMNMGYNRTELQPSGADHFSGTGMLPVCVRHAMEWEARVLLHTDRGLLAAPFRFITVTPGLAPPGG